MTNAHAPNRKPGNRNARKRRIRSRPFFLIESRAWRGPSQIRIRKPNRFPGVRAAATGSGGGEGISGRFGGGGAKQERQCRPMLTDTPSVRPQSSFLRRQEPRRPPPQQPHQTQLRKRKRHCRLAASFHTPPARPLFLIWDSFRVPPPRPLFPTCDRELKPATGKRVQSWAGSPMGTQTRQSQAAPILARFQSRSWTAPPQAQKSRKKRERQCNSNQLPAPLSPRPRGGVCGQGERS